MPNPHTALQQLCAGLGMKGPPTTWDGLLAVMNAEKETGLLSFAQAEVIAGELHDRWQVMTGKAPMSREDMAWADIVQFVIRKAREVTGG